MTPAAGGDVRVEFVNRAMMEFQRYPDDVVYPGAMMSDIRRFQAKRGDFGKIDDIEAFVKQQVAHPQVPGGVKFERPSASGHYIEVSYKPLDNGTIISIHRNITELKERETSLAAAKEGAETARADAENTRVNVPESITLFPVNCTSATFLRPEDGRNTTAGSRASLLRKPATGPPATDSTARARRANNSGVPGIVSPNIGSAFRTASRRACASPARSSKRYGYNDPCSATRNTAS